jgi:hypothetical protein
MDDHDPIDTGNNPDRIVGELDLDPPAILTFGINRHDFGKVHPEARAFTAGVDNVVAGLDLLTQEVLTNFNARTHWFLSL